jgi:hypothetical protein
MRHEGGRREPRQDPGVRPSLRALLAAAACAAGLAALGAALPGAAEAQREPHGPVRVDAWPEIVVAPEGAPLRALADVAPGTPVRVSAFQVALRTDEPLAVRLVRLVTRTDGDLHRVVGVLDRVAGDTLILTTGVVPRPMRLPLGEVAMLEAKGGHYEWAGARQGAQVGALTGGVLLAVLYRNGWAALVGSVIGAAPGAAIGAWAGAADWEPVRTDRDEGGG